MTAAATGGGDAGPVLRDQQLKDLAGRLVQVSGVVAVVLGGSRARGEHTPASDVDLGLHYRAPLDMAGLEALGRSVAGPGARLTQPGEWGPAAARHPRHFNFYDSRDNLPARICPPCVSHPLSWRLNEAEHPQVSDVTTAHV
jgi:hypothetical protein